MWIALLIILLLFIALIGWLLIYSGNACEYDDWRDGDFEDCWRCSHCSRIWGVCRLTNASVRKGQKCNVDEELAKQELLKKK